MIERGRFIQLMAGFMAELAPSVTRGQLSGVRANARKYLRENAETLLRKLACPATFESVLNDKTKELQLILPGQSWGVARKCLNIFLRDATFNSYLRQEYRLIDVEPLLEVPLDRRVATRLRDKYPHLGQWVSIKDLKPCVSAQYQSAALSLAKEHGIERVHLDLWFYPNDD